MYIGIGGSQIIAPVDKDIRQSQAIKDYKQ